MKKLLIFLLLPLLASSAEPYDAKKAPFDVLYANSQRAGDTPENIRIRDTSYAELMARGPDTLSNLLARIHIENVMLGVYAVNLTKTTPVPKDQALPVLSSFYSDERHVTRRMAVFLSGFYIAPEFADRVYPMLDHEKTRGAAVRALGKWRVTNAVPRIVKILRDDPKERVRVSAANALRDIGSDQAIQPLIAALGDEVWSVRNTAARALVSLGPSAVEPLLASLERPPADGAKLRQMIRCLGDLKDKRAVFPLRALAEATAPDTREDADHALNLISGKRDDVWFGPGGE